MHISTKSFQEARRLFVAESNPPHIRDVPLLKALFMGVCTAKLTTKATILDQWKLKTCGEDGRTVRMLALQLVKYSVTSNPIPCSQ